MNFQPAPQILCHILVSCDIRSAAGHVVAVVAPLGGGVVDQVGGTGHVVGRPVAAAEEEAAVPRVPEQAVRLRTEEVVLVSGWRSGRRAGWLCKGEKLVLEWGHALMWNMITKNLCTVLIIYEKPYP